MFWLGFINFFFAPFAGAALGLTATLRFCGLSVLAHGAALVTGTALAGTIGYLGVKKLPGERPGVYTLRQGIPVVVTVGAEVSAELFFAIPLPCLAALGLVVWGIMRR